MSLKDGKIVWEYKVRKIFVIRDGVQQPTVEILMTPC